MLARGAARTGDRGAVSVERTPVALSIDALAQQAARRDGAPAGSVIVVDREIAGRIRGGVEWTAQNAIAVASIARPVALGAETADVAWLAAGLATADAVTELTHCATDCWWPDGIVTKDLPGVRVATGAITLLGPGRVDVAILLARIGVIAGLGGGRDAIATELASSLAAATDWLDEPETLVERYRARCATLGREVRARLLPAGMLHGRAADVRSSGALVIETPTGLLESTTVASTWSVIPDDS